MQIGWLKPRVPLSGEAKAKLSAYRMGKSLSPEIRQLMSETRKGSDAYRYDKKHSEETKAKMSAAKQGGFSSPLWSKTISQNCRSNEGKSLSY